MFILECRSPISSYSPSLHDALPILTALRDRIALLEERLAEQESLHAELAGANIALRDSLYRAERVLRVREAQMRALQDDLRALKDRKSTRLNSSHVKMSYAVFCLKK